MQRLIQQRNLLTSSSAEQSDGIKIITTDHESVISRKSADEKLFKPGNQQVIQRGKKKASSNVKKHKAGQWYSKYNPFKIFSTQDGAKKYHSRLINKYNFVPTTDLSDLTKKDSNNRYILKYNNLRALTLYTYMMTKPDNQLSVACQGPHTVAFRVSATAILGADTVDKVEQIFKEQVPDVAEIKTIMDNEKNDNKALQLRINRYIRDYGNIHKSLANAILDLKSRKGTGLRRIKHLLNHLINMHPYATYSWKSGKRAGKKSLKGKGENVSNPTFSVLCDTTKAKFNDSTKFTAFKSNRENLFNQYTPT